MSNLLKNLLSATAICLATSAFAAEDQVSADTVVATVNGEEITLGQMIMTREALPPQYAQLPANVLFPGILDQLIQQAALSQTMNGDKPKRVEVALQNEERTLMAGVAIEKVIAVAIDEAAIQAVYEADYVAAQPGLEFNASHILVETAEKAAELITELENGANFAQLAKEHSTGPSGPGGGNLGWFGEGAMVPPFEMAVKQLEVGAVSEPVETQFGWHVVKLNETRLLDTPPLEEVRTEIEEKLRMQAVENKVTELTSGAKIDRSGSEGLDPNLIANTKLLEN